MLREETRAARRSLLAPMVASLLIAAVVCGQAVLLYRADNTPIPMRELRTTTFDAATYVAAQAALGAVLVALVIADVGLARQQVPVTPRAVAERMTWSSAVFTLVVTVSATSCVMAAGYPFTKGANPLVAIVGVALAVVVVVVGGLVARPPDRVIYGMAMTRLRIRDLTRADLPAATATSPVRTVLELLVLGVIPALVVLGELYLAYPESGYVDFGIMVAGLTITALVATRKLLYERAIKGSLTVALFALAGVAVATTAVGLGLVAVTEDALAQLWVVVAALTCVLGPLITAALALGGPWRSRLAFYRALGERREEDLAEAQRQLAAYEDEHRRVQRQLPRV